MKIAISGSHGFIGSHLSEAFKVNGYEILRITRDLLYSPNDLQSLLENEQPEIIAHLAAYGNHSNQTDEAMTVLSNIVGTFNLMSASNKIKYTQLLNFSSLAVTLPFETFYTASKKSTEAIARAFVNKYDNNIVNIRPASVFGPGEADFRFIPTVCNSLLSGEVLKLDPNPVHDWVYIDDFVKYIIDGMENHLFQKGKIYEVGNSRSWNNMEVVEILQKIAHQEANIEIVTNQRPYDIRSSLSVKQGIPSHISLGDGLRKTFEYYKDKYEKRN